MKLIEINWSPTNRQLRQFGVIAPVVLPLLGWRWGGSPAMIAILSIAGFAAGGLAWFFPRGLKPAFIALSIVAIPIGLVVGESALSLIYYGVFLPMGLSFRLARRDPLQRRFDRQAKTYWQPKQQPTGPAGYFRLW